MVFKLKGIKERIIARNAYAIHAESFIVMGEKHS
jgi:hypothetical protein